MAKTKFNVEDLFKQVSEITESGLPLMEGKEKLDSKEILGEVVTVDEYGFMEGEEGEYVVISLQEYPQNFIYGGSVVSEAFKKFDGKFDDEQKKTIIEHGLTFVLEEKKSANKRNYTKITLFPK